MTFFTDSPYERLMVQAPESPRRECDAPAVSLSKNNMPAASITETREKSEEETCS